MNPEDIPPGEADRPRSFATTDWSVVCAAGDADTALARGALARLCETYWYPLYAYVRRRGHSAENAEDLTQEFFARFIEHRWMCGADPARGRFRSYLLMVAKRFLANEWDKAKTEKRGGRVRITSFCQETAEALYARQSATAMAPELEFDREWALTLVGEVLRQMAQEYEHAGKRELFERLKPCLLGTGNTVPYAVLCPEVGMSEAAFKMAVSRLRRRYRERLREEVARTVAVPEDVDSELRHLFRVLAKA